MALDEEARAEARAWNYVFGFISPTVLKTTIQLELPDIIEKHGGPISLTQLSAASGCKPDALFRIMRFLIHQGIFKKTQGPDNKLLSSETEVYYAQTSLSRFFARDKIAPFVMLHAAAFGDSNNISVEALRGGKCIPEDRAIINAEDTWSDPAFGNHMKLFTDSMEAHARVTVSAIIRNHPEAFEGIRSLADVGGRHGLATSMLVEAFPWVQGICFDLPEVVAKAPPRSGINFIGGNMFDRVPKADAVMLMWILHDWSDKACIDILKKCKEAVPANTGKVMIVESIVDEDGEEDEFTSARLSMDMIMLDVTVHGKERTYKEWAYLLKEAGFSRHTVKNIKTIESVIEAYP